MFTTILPQLIDVNRNTKLYLPDNGLGMSVPGITCAEGAVDGVFVPSALWMADGEALRAVDSGSVPSALWMVDGEALRAVDSG